VITMYAFSPSSTIRCVRSSLLLFHGGPHSLGKMSWLLDQKVNKELLHKWAPEDVVAFLHRSVGLDHCVELFEVRLH